MLYASICVAVFPQIIDEHEEKILCLTEAELLKVLEEQVAALLKSCVSNELPVPDFLASYMKFHGHSLRLPDYGVSSVVELMQKIPRVTRVSNHLMGSFLTARGTSYRAL